MLFRDWITVTTVTCSQQTKSQQDNSSVAILGSEILISQGNNSMFLIFHGPLPKAQWLSTFKYFKHLKSLYHGQSQETWWSSKTIFLPDVHFQGAWTFHLEIKFHSYSACTAMQSLFAFLATSFKYNFIKLMFVTGIKRPGQLTLKQKGSGMPDSKFQRK